MSNTTGQKYGGRTKGTPNKATAEIREAFQLIVENNLKQFQKDINELEPKDRLKFLIDLSRFVLPTLKAIDVHSNAGSEFKPIIISFED